MRISSISIIILYEDRGGNNDYAQRGQTQHQIPQRTQGRFQRDGLDSGHVPHRHQRIGGKGRRKPQDLLSPLCGHQRRARGCRKRSFGRHPHHHRQVRLQGDRLRSLSAALGDQRRGFGRERRLQQAVVFQHDQQQSHRQDKESFQTGVQGHFRTDHERLGRDGDRVDLRRLRRRRRIPFMVFVRSRDRAQTGRSRARRGDLQRLG